ncbi:hypothetical protein XocBAI21_14270, partial [Xanthomonas oryzae pv. oryzicola]
MPRASFELQAVPSSGAAPHLLPMGEGLVASLHVGWAMRTCTRSSWHADVPPEVAYCHAYS